MLQMLHDCYLTPEHCSNVGWWVSQACGRADEWATPQLIKILIMTDQMAMD